MSAESAAPRILLCGDVEGRLMQLYKRFAAVNKANGPFDCLFCVGQFFPPTEPPEGLPPEIAAFAAGASKAPVPTYFTGDYGHGALEALLGVAEVHAGRPATPTAPGVEVAKNLTWLRGSGVATFAGLQVAYLAGKSPPPGEVAAGVGTHGREDVVRLVDQAASCGTIDLLLTNEWPEGVTRGQAHLPDGAAAAAAGGSAAAAEVAKELQPRYHVAGSQGLFFAREPYRNPGTGHATRFIGLAAVGNDKKQKFLHALRPTPASQLSVADLAAPPGATPSPFEEPSQPAAAASRATAGTTPWHGNTGAGGTNFVAAGGGSATPRPPSPPRPAWVAKVEREEEEGKGQYWRYSAPPPKRQRREGGGAAGASDGERICFEFASKGTCARGDGCRFQHALAGGRPLPKNACFEFLQRGSCEKGADCRFRHSLDEEVGEGDAGGGASGNGAPPGGLPKGVCFDFVKRGRCERGAECRFRHAADEPGGGSRPARAAAPPEPCWFCLASPDVDAHLVVSVGEHCYLALAKGPLVPGHVLVLPIEHFPSAITLPSEAVAEVGRYKDALRRCFGAHSGGAVPLVFERYLQLRAGTHAHLQVVPIPQASAAGVRGAFEAAALKAGIQFQAIPPGRSTAQLIDDVRRISIGGNYFVVELPGDDGALACPLPSGGKFPMQFGREVAAEILGAPERGDWKACKLSKEEETKMAKDFGARFQEYDVM